MAKEHHGVRDPLLDFVRTEVAVFLEESKVRRVNRVVRGYEFYTALFLAGILLALLKEKGHV